MILCCIDDNPEALFVHCADKLKPPGNFQAVFLLQDEVFPKGLLNEETIYCKKNTN